MPEPQTSQHIQTATLQAKSLTRLLQIGLSHAKELLAKGPYACASWSDFQTRIKKGTLDITGRMLLLAATDRNARRYFEQIIDDVIHRLTRLVSIEDLSPLELRKGIYRVFANGEKTWALSELFSTIEMPDWHETEIGSDPHAILSAHCEIEGQEFKLFAIRTCRFLFTDGLSDFAPFLIEFPVPSRIVWTDAEQLEEAMTRYEFNDGPESELIFPEYQRNRTMKNLEKWLVQLRGYVQDQLWGADEKRYALPLRVDGASYFVVGFPMQPPNQPCLALEHAKVCHGEYPRIVCIGSCPVLIDDMPAHLQQSAPMLTSGEKLPFSHIDTPLSFIRSVALADIEFAVDAHQRLKPLRVREEPNFRWFVDVSHVESALQITEHIARRPAYSNQDAVEPVLLFDLSVIKEDTGHPFHLTVVGEWGDSFFAVPLLRGFPERDVQGGRVIRKWVVDYRMQSFIRIVGKRRLLNAIGSRCIGHDEVVRDLFQPRI